jgi:hypothetical protein
MIMAVLAAACGGGGGTVDASIDGRDLDAPAPDALAADATGIDAAAAGYTGRIVVDEVSVQDHIELGRGGLVSIEFGPLPGVPPVFDDRDAQGFGCAAWVHDLSEGTAPPRTNEGTVTISGASAPMPPCIFDSDPGYHCPAGGGSGGAGDAIIDDAAGPGTAALVDAAPSAYTFGNADIGRQLWIAGATPWNNGLFPIIAVDTATNAVIYANPQALPQATFVGSYLVEAAAGPVPFGQDFLADDDTLQVALASGVGGHFDSFTVPVGSGDAFALDAPSESAIAAVPFDGAALTLDCAGYSGQCGDGAVTSVDLVSTDGVPDPARPEYALPEPADRWAVVRCVVAGTEVIIPAEAMAVVAATAPTRVSTTYRRAMRVVAQNDGDANRTTVLVGHAITGYSDPPPPPADAGVDAATDLPDAAPPDAFVCSGSLVPTSDGSSAARRALLLSEINPGDYIELYNSTASLIDLDTVSYQFCSPFNYCALATVGAGVTVPAGGYATVPWPTGANCVANFPDTDLGGEVILYLNSIFSADDNIMDFVCWGTGHSGNSRKSQAEATGKWTGPCAPALVSGALHRKPATDGIDASDYDAISVPTPMNCTP